MGLLATPRLSIFRKKNLPVRLQRAIFYKYIVLMPQLYRTVKLKEHFDKKQIGVKELFTNYQPSYTIRNVPTYMVIGTYLQVY